MAPPRPDPVTDRMRGVRYGVAIGAISLVLIGTALAERSAPARGTSESRPAAVAAAGGGPTAASDDFQSAFDSTPAYDQGSVPQPAPQPAPAWAAPSSSTS